MGGVQKAREKKWKIHFTFERFVVYLNFFSEVVYKTHVEVSAPQVLVVHVREHLHVPHPEPHCCNVGCGVPEVAELHHVAVLFLLGCC